MDESSVCVVIESIQKGEIDEFQTILRAYQNPVYKYCLHILGHRQDAEDATQEVFLKAFRKLEQYNQSISFSAWLYKIAYHHCIDMIRKRKIKGFLPLFKVIERAKHVDRIDEDYFSDDIHLSLQKLSLEERNLLILRGVEQRPFNEIGVILSQKPVSLRKKYERTVEKFKALYYREKGGNENEAGTLFGENQSSI